MMRIILHVCAGLTPMTDRLLVRPKLPPGVKQLTLTNVQWRQATLDFTILGTGTPSLHLDGNPVGDIPAELAGRHQVVAHC